MTSPNDDIDHTSDDKTTDKGKLDLSPVQVAASALAAISSAVAASYLGVGGTVLGAGVGSVIATVSTAVYQQSLKRTNEKLRQVVPVPTLVVRPAAQGQEQPADPAELPDLTDPDLAHPQQGRAGTGQTTPLPGDALPGHGAVGRASVPDGGRVPGTPAGSAAGAPPAATAGASRLPWSRLAAAAAVVFVVAFGLITAVELAAGGSLASLVRGDDRNGTTISRVVTGTSGAEQDVTPTPTEAPDTTESPSAEPSESSSPDGGPTDAPESPDADEPSPERSAGEPAESGAPIAPTTDPSPAG